MLRTALIDAVKTGLLGQLGAGASLAQVSAHGLVARVHRFRDQTRVYRWTVGRVDDQEGARSAATMSADLACEAAAQALATLLQEERELAMLRTG